MEKRAAAIGSTIFFLLGPGTFMALIPWLLTRWEAAHLPSWWWPLRLMGVLLVLAGVAVVAQAFVRFVGEGAGTPMPAAAPQRLVIGGLYRHVRNPMYVGMIAAILGQALWLGRWELPAFAAGLWVFAAAYVKWREESALERRFGAPYSAYRAAVPAWIPRLRPWTPPASTQATD
ncbi:MAG: isoprenylcysteine carboxylmethyltransferase family protein [Caldilineaceae bacterium]|nr:isoprenylcysteine carboxylmethyltransferase family protein [Caldilineaceae bacterium]